jgi:hypothetical protein
VGQAKQKKNHPAGTTLKEQADNVTFSLVEFERYAYSGNVRSALECLKKFLILSEVSYGGLHGSPMDQYMVSRLTSAITAVFANPKLVMQFPEYSNLMIHYQWLTVLFGVSQFRNADHVIQCLSTAPHGKIDIKAQDLMKVMLLWSMDSQLDFDCASLWQSNEGVACSLFMAQMGCRMAITKKAFDQKNKVLQFLANNLRDDVLQNISFSNMTDVMMHVDYSTEPSRYEVKRKLASFLTSTFEKKRIEPYMRNGAIPKEEKPRLVIIFDWYHDKHVVHRALHSVIRLLRERFYVIGMVITDEPLGVTAVAGVCDEVETPESVHMGMRIDEVTKRIAKARPDAIFYPGIGLSQFGVVLASLRLAKVQITSHGHPSSSYSKNIDYFLVEEGYRECTQDFSETVIYVPNGSFPQTKQIDVVYPKTKLGFKNSIDIAVSLSLMKMNPLFLKTCQDIQRMKPEVVFHFMVGVSFGISKDYADYHIKQYLPKAIIYGHQPREDYMKLVANCDLFIVPFPFGNSNAMLDCIAQGLPGVCMDGDKIYSHMAAFYMQWLKQPDRLLVSMDTNEYIHNVMTIIKLVQDFGLRLPEHAEAAVYEGNPMNVVTVMDFLVRGGLNGVPQ